MLTDANESLHVRAAATHAHDIGYEPRRDMWRGMLVCEQADGDGALVVDVRDCDDVDGPLVWEPDEEEQLNLSEAMRDFFKEHPWCSELRLDVALVRLKPDGKGANIQWNVCVPVRADEV